MGLWRDPSEGQHQPRHKGDAIRNGHRTHYCLPRDGRIPVRHTAQGTSFTERTAILQNGGMEVTGTEVSSRHEITWSGSAAGSASFNSEAAAVGIRGTAGAIGIPGAEGIVDRVRGERRAETGLSRLSGLFGLSCWPDRNAWQAN